MAREIRILHTADTHLGYRQYHNEVRRKDFFEAFELVVNDAVEMQVDAVVHAGDLFDSRNPILEDLLETMNILSRLKAADIPFFGIVGNHESKQNTQWLDLFEEMGLAARLGKNPHMVGNVAIYGIDSVPKSKIPIFDYSVFEAPDSPAGFAPEENGWKLLVMHQIMSPFPYAEWDCDEVLENLPFKVDAVLLGDYHEHAIVKNKTGETWITYPGSTERNSLSENEARSYNIITLSEKGLEISKRTIPTRNFLSIQVNLTGEDEPYEQIFSAVNEHLEEIPESVVFLEIFGDSSTVLSQSELEEYLLNKGALVSNVKDRRIKESFPEEVLKVTFSDPDHAVANEIKRMNLNDGGLIIDEIVRSPNISRSRVDEETEGRLSNLIEAKVMDFKSPDFRIEIPSNTTSSDEPAYTSGSASSATTARFLEFEEINADDAGEAGFAGKKRPAGIVTGKLEITELSGILRTSDKINNTEKKSTEASKSMEVSKSIETSAVSPDSSGLASESSSQCISNSESLIPPDSGLIELSSESIASPELNFPQESSRTPGKAQEARIEFRKDKESEPEVKPENQAESKLPEKGPEKKIRKLSELKVKGKPGKARKLPEEEPAQTTDLTGKTEKAGQKKGKRKTAVPRQYNLGDYL
ncbi:metallophosphoesterase family protein [Methanosarcina sp. UBA289]|uniref:metallophosphoesterase family protein n=1 Tax=Methanosarcina sp. UBA289 TaxID=1915574 RepID=UPI0025CF47EE|nr:exonuclease SbcCD subunit D [Methanosarcina sp. UBA289]